MQNPQEFWNVPGIGYACTLDFFAFTVLYILVDKSELYTKDFSHAYKSLKFVNLLLANF